MRTAHNITDASLIKAGYRLLSSLFVAYDFPIFSVMMTQILSTISYNIQARSYLKTCSP
jgi:hypothetical protein